MTTATIIQMTILFFLLLCSGFFSASETALMSLSKIRIRNMVDEQIKHADTIDRLVKQPSKLLGAILIGNNIVNIGASALATSLAIEHFGNAGIGIATGLMTFFVLIFGEITPKTLAAQKAEKTSLGVVRIIDFITTVLGPVLFVLLKLTNKLVSLFGGDANSDRPFVTEEELKMLVTVGQEEGILESEEKKMIHNVFEFGDEMVKNVMTPRMDMVAIPISSSYTEIVEHFKSSQYSRLPVYEDIRDNIIGVIYLKDLFFFTGDVNTFSIHDILRKPIYTFELKNTFELFNELKTQHLQMAIVLDEHGGTAGIVTIEDLVEEIVGELRDEYDEGDIEIEALKDNEYLVSGKTKIEVVNETIEIDLNTEEFETIGGFVTGNLGRMGLVGDTIQVQDVQFKIMKMHKNRITLLKIHA